jgi:gliding motility-associated lipoprotein GldH
MLFQTKKLNSSHFFFLSFISCALIFFSCQTIDLYERVVSIPHQEWKSSFKPQFNFIIKDTQTRYDVYVVLRHNEKYEYNNIWISLSYQLKGQEPVTGQYELPLANNEGWVGTAMDDLYEHRIRITPPEGISLKPGEYTFTIGQIMRKDPLDNVLNVGLRIEKKPQ